MLLNVVVAGKLFYGAVANGWLRREVSGNQKGTQTRHNYAGE